jgi:hypothetical protein
MAKPEKKTDVKGGDAKAPGKPKLKVIQGGKSEKKEDKKYDAKGDKKEDKSSEYFSVINDYTYAALAAHSYLQGEHPDMEGARVALEQMYKNMGADSKDKWEGARLGSLASSEGVMRAIKSYYGEYENARKKLTLEQIPSLYDMKPYIEKLDETSKKNFEATFKGSETLEKIMEKVDEAGKIAKSKPEDSKEYKEAEEILKKYSRVINTIARFEKTKLNKIKIAKLDDLVLRNSLNNDFAAAA